MTLTYRRVKGSQLTSAEADANVDHLLLSSNLSFTQSGTGAITTETVQAALRRMVFSGQYNSTTNFNTAQAALTDTLGAFNLNIGGNLGAISGSPRSTPFTFTISNHIDTTTDARLLDVDTTILGANQMVGSTGIVSHNHIQVSGLVTSAIAAFSGSPTLEGNGTITFANAYNGAVHLVSGSGVITNGDVFLARVGTQTGSGTITTLAGFHANNLGGAAIANAYGLLVDDITGSPTRIAGIRSQVSSGANKYNLYLDGTAQNFITGIIYLQGSPADIFSQGGIARWGTLTANNAQILVNSATIGTFSPTGLGVVGVVDIVGTAVSATASHLQLGSSTQATIGANGAASALTANPLGYLVAFLGTTKIIIPYYNG